MHGGKCTKGADIQDLDGVENALHAEEEAIVKFVQLSIDRGAHAHHVPNIGRSAVQLEQLPLGYLWTAVD